MELDLSPIIARTRANFARVEADLAAPGVANNRKDLERLGREHQRLTRLLGNWDAWQRAQKELADSRGLLATETDAEFRKEIEAEIARLEADAARLHTQVLTAILPPDPNDSRNTIVEIRPAAGGDEAALFAMELYRLYSRYAERRGWKLEVLDLSETNLGGIRELSFALQGDNVYRELNRESGVHRVQRVPSTEASGRIHTSTVTVAVLPEAEDVDVQINPADLQVDVYRASGAGGQHVNKTDSAVRITHLPTGVVAASQQERSQHRNREIAMRILRSRLLEAKQRAATEKYEAERRSQVGTGDRSERIRTYNFPQNRITDHRYGLSWHNLPAMFDGDLQQMFDDIHASEATRRLEAELAKA